MSAVLVCPRLIVVLENGAEMDVQGTNRDLVRWDRTRAARKWPKHDEAPFLWMTFVAWAALNREGTYPGNFDQFDAECLSVRTVDADGVDPTRPEPGDD